MTYGEAIKKFRAYSKYLLNKNKDGKLLYISILKDINLKTREKELNFIITKKKRRCGHAILGRGMKQF